MDQGNQPIEIVDRDGSVSVGLIDEMKPLRVHARRRMLLKKALSGLPVRAAHDRKHAAGDMWLHPRPNLRVIVRQLLFGDAAVRPVHPVRIGQLHRAWGDCQRGI